MDQQSLFATYFRQKDFTSVTLDKLSVFWEKHRGLIILSCFSHHFITPPGTTRKKHTSGPQKRCILPGCLLRKCFQGADGTKEKRRQRNGQQPTELWICCSGWDPDEVVTRSWADPCLWGCNGGTSENMYIYIYIYYIKYIYIYTYSTYRM